MDVYLDKFPNMIFLLCMKSKIDQKCDSPLQNTMKVFIRYNRIKFCCINQIQLTINYNCTISEVKQKINKNLTPFSR